MPLEGSSSGTSSRKEPTIPPVQTRRARRGGITIGIYLLVCFLAQLWPTAALANRIEPRVLGLPFLLFWYVAGVFAVFLGLVAMYLGGSAGERG